MDLILPIAGKSSRFPNMKPKWMLTHPSGRIMLIESILGLPLHQFERVIVVCLKEHEENFQIKEGIQKSFKEINLFEKLEIIFLEKETKSQPETVYEGLVRGSVKDSFYVKDCDNFFEISEFDDSCNLISVFSLHDLENVNASNKSYVEINDNEIVTNIVEKQVISSDFCCGGYFFNNPPEYIDVFNTFSSSSDLYLSHIILKMILNNKTPFKVNFSKKYVDWGTKKEWNNFKSQFGTVFLDIDGVLFFNAGKYFPPTREHSLGIKENIDYINSLFNSNKVKIILTTARSKDEKEVTINQLTSAGVKYHEIIFDLPHAKRIVVNDFANSNPFPSCLSVNIKRNDTSLKEMLLKEFKLN